MTTTIDPQSDQARLTRHRAASRVVHPDISAAVRRNAERQALMIQQRDEAVQHLQKILNRSRTATESWQAEQEARQWLESVGSEA